MGRIEIFGIKIEEDITPSTNLPELIVREAETQAQGIVEDMSSS